MRKTKRQMKINLFIIIILFLTSCENESSLNKELKNDSYITKFFSSEEINEIEKIIKFVDNLILINNIHIDIDKAYHYYLDSINELAFEGDRNAMTFDEKIKYKFLFDLDNELFNEIWEKQNTSRLIHTRDTTLHNLENFITIDLNIKGKYLQMLNEIEDNNMLFKEIYNDSQAIGGLPPTLITGFFYYNHKYDFNEIHYRLWAAILLLSIEESYEQKVERYLNK